MVSVSELERAIRGRRLVTFDYVDSKGESTSNRRGEPYEIRGGDVFIYDLGRGGIRRFHIRNMSRLRVLPETFVPRWTV